MGKTGTTDNFADAWLIVSTPGITLGGWAGYDNNTPTNSKTGYTYNAQYMARLTSAIYNANPGIFKTGDKFNIDSSAIKQVCSNQQVLNQQQCLSMVVMFL